MGLCASLGACCALLLVCGILSANQEVLDTRGRSQCSSRQAFLLCNQDCARLSSTDLRALTVSSSECAACNSKAAQAFRLYLSISQEKLRQVSRVGGRFDLDTKILPDWGRHQSSICACKSGCERLVYAKVDRGCSQTRSHTRTSLALLCS